MAANSSAVGISLTLSQSLVAPGQQLGAIATFRNTGFETWTKVGTQPYRVGTQNPQDNSLWGRNRWDLPYDVAPGQTVSVSVLLIAPTTPGEYGLTLKLVHENVNWFGTPLATRIRVDRAAPPAPVPPPASTPDPIPATPAESVAWPAPFPLDSSTMFREIINTGALKVDSQMKRFAWRNTSGSSLLVRSVELWCGVGMGTIADVNGELTYRGSMLEHIGWDRYAETPGPIHFKRREFPRDMSIIIPDGEEIVLSAFANPVLLPLPQGAGHHWIATIGAQKT